MAGRIVLKSSKTLKKIDGESSKPNRNRKVSHHPDREGQFVILWAAFAGIAGKEIPEAQFKFHDKRKWRFDFAWPSCKVAVEIEGGVYAKDGKSRHRSIMGFLGDVEKYNNAAALGWCLLRFTADDLDKRSKETIEFIVAAIKSRNGKK